MSDPPLVERSRSKCLKGRGCRDTKELILDQVAAVPAHMPMGAAAVGVGEALGLSTAGAADAARRAVWAGHSRHPLTSVDLRPRITNTRAKMVPALLR